MSPPEEPYDVGVVPRLRCENESDTVDASDVDSGTFAFGRPTEDRGRRWGMRRGLGARQIGA